MRMIRYSQYILILHNRDSHAVVSYHRILSIIFSIELPLKTHQCFHTTI
jgi:hypothetical protein